MERKCGEEVAAAKGSDENLVGELCFEVRDQTKDRNRTR